MDMPRWLPGYAGNTRPLTWPRKGDVPDLATARRVDFGLAGWAWCRFRGSTVEMPGGGWLRVHEARLHVGWYIGPRDLTAADCYTHKPELAQGWRESLRARIAEECGLAE